MTERIARLEQRVEALEQALRLQAAFLGQCIESVASATTNKTLTPWVCELLRDIRREPVSPHFTGLIDGFLHGAAQQLDPTVEALRVPA